MWHMKFQGFDAYAPLERITRIKRGKKIKDARRLFPRYVFVWIIDTWHALFSTIGVSRVLLNTNQTPARLPDGWVESIRAREARDGLITLPRHRFNIGQHVQVTGGLFAGARGLYQGMTSQEREIVLLEAIGARVELASGLLR